MNKKSYQELELVLVATTDDVVRTSGAQDDCFGEGTKPNNGWEGEVW